MKNKLLILIILGIFLFSLTFTSAFSLNSKNFNKNIGKYGKYEIKNFFGTKLKDVTLTENTEVCNGDECYAIMDLVLYKKGTLIDDVIFYKDINGKWVETNIRDYTFYINTNNTQRKVDDYEYKCNITGYSSNSTPIKECSNVKTGSHYEDNPEWSLLDTTQEYKAGLYQIKLVGHKKPSWKIDWQIETSGIWTKDWAVWGTNIYDIYDSNYNETLWQNASTGLASSRFVKENNEYLTVYTQGANPTAPGTNYVETKLLNNSVDTNITVRVLLNYSKANMNVDGYANSSLYVFGTLIKEIGCSGEGSCSGSDDSVWIFLKNETDSKFYAYDDGVFQKSFTASNNQIRLYVEHESDDSINLAKAQGTIYPINYIESSIILNSPTNNYISDTNNVQFNATATVTGGATLTNMSLWTNESGDWAIKNTTTISKTVLNNYNQSNNLSIVTLQGSGTGKVGTSITTGGSPITIAGFIKDSSTNCGYGYLMDSSRSNVLLQGTFSGNYIQFNQSLILATSTKYWLVVDDNGGSCSWYRSGQSVGLLPISDNGFTWSTSWDGSSERTNIEMVVNSIVFGTISNPLFQTQTFNRTITDDIIWNVQACDSDGDCGFAPSNYSLFIDTVAPTIDLLSPNEIFNYGTDGSTLYLTGFVNDTNIDTVWYEYNGTNTTFSATTQTLFNESITQSTSDKTSLTVWANDSVGNTNSQKVSWDYEVFENLIEFNEETIEGATEIITINFTNSLQKQISKVDLYYGNSIKSTTYSSSGDYILATSTFSVDQVTTDTNKTFYFEITYTDNSKINSSSNIQLVKAITLDDCSVNTFKIFNLTLVDEETQVLLTDNTTIEYNFEIFPVGITNSVMNLTGSINANNVSLCTNIDINNTSYEVDSSIKYSADSHAIEYYNLQKFEMNSENIPQNITLYDLSSDVSVDFQINYKDSSFLPVENALITINRQYIKEGVFKTVEVVKTDSTGQTVVHLDEKDVLYNIIVSKDGKVLASYDNMIAFCEDSTTGLCRINLIEPSSPTTFFDYGGDNPISVDMSYNYTTRVFTYSFITVDGSVKTVNVILKQEDMLGSTIVCNESLQTASGTISCTIPISIGNSTVTIYSFVDDKLMSISQLDLKEKVPYGKYGYVVFFFFLIAIVLMLSGSKSGMVFGSIIGFIGAGLLSLQNNGSRGILASIIWLIVAGGILIYTLNKRGSST